MNPSVIWSVILLSFVNKTRADAIWEFGKNSKKSIVVEEISGHIKLFEKHTQLPLIAGHCMKLVFVRVQVYNILSTPQVWYNEHKQTVNIIYKLSQSSASQYEVLGKAVPVHDCNKKKKEENPSNEADDDESNSDDDDNLDDSDDDDTSYYDNDSSDRKECTDPDDDYSDK